jgi:Mg-chelatase subunit ChlI
MMIPDGAGEGPMLQEATRELEAAIHDARVAFDCIALGENDRAHTSAVTARVAIEAAVTALQAALAHTAGRKDAAAPATGVAGASGAAADLREADLREADVENEVPEPQVQITATGPMHDERQEDDRENDDDQPEEEHDNCGDGVTADCSGSNHGRQLPDLARLTRL